MNFSEQLFANFSGCRIFCGFSGGADSTAALLIARKYRDRFGYVLEAVHFNHHLRGEESDREAEEARIFAQSLEIPFQCIDLSIPQGENLESAARSARLEAWKKILPPKSAVVLGHHADDRRENLLIRLCRGSNSGGLSSMQQVSVIDNITFIRPLLRMTRKEIEDLLRSSGVTSWAEDSSNSSTLFLRNYLRNRFLPELEELFPGSLKGLERSINALEDDASFINSYVNAIPSEKKKSTAFWRSQHNAVKIRLLRELTGLVPTYDLLERVNKELERTSTELRRIPVKGSLEIFLRGDTIEMGVPALSPPAPFFWNWRQTPAITQGPWHFEVSSVPQAEKCSPDCAFFDGELLPDVLEISLPQPGERMLLFGTAREEKIKKLRTDRKIPADACFPVVRAGDIICWAVMVRHGAFAATTPKSRDIVKFEFKTF